ncbi:MAG: sodium:calcium antiporter [Bacteroidota bacterium]|nr:sodium:calcium antiporter [Bacteroidota bacterium]
MHIESLSFPVLLAIFLTAAAAIWIAGIQLSNTTDILSNRFGLGEALGGMIILAIVTNLPEIAIVVSASLENKMGIAIGNILGGIAIQTVVLVLLDLFGLGREDSLTYKSASLVLVLEGLLVLAVLSLVIVGNQLPPNVIFLRVTPADILIFSAWIVGIVLINKARKDLPWIANFKVPGGQEEPQGHSKIKKSEQATKDNTSTKKAVFIFLFCALVTLIAGVALERSGDAMATHLGMQGVIFGATILAAATSLPELSTGLASIKMKDYQMAVSDIFGGNSFLPVLFLIASLCSGKAVLPLAQKTDIYLTAVAMILTSVYIWGLFFRPRLQILFMGLDSFIVLVLYMLGLAGLIAIGP